MQNISSRSNNLQTLEYDQSINQIRRVAYQTIGPLLIATGIVGNILNLLVLSRPFFNSCTRTYLRALAVADINILLFDISMMVRLNNKQNANAFTAYYHAYVEIPILTTFIAFNVYIVTCLTVDRYISVCAPTRFSSFHTSKKAKVAVVVSICVSILISLPLILLKTVCYRNRTNNWSFKDNTEITNTGYWYVYIIVSELLMRIGPAILVATLNILIIREFKIITKKRNETLSTDIKIYICRTKKYQEEKRLVILLQIVVVLFCTTMIPSSCLSMWYTVHPKRDYTFEVFRAVANLLEMTNFALNFCAYFLCSKEFRKGLLSIFTNSHAGAKSLNKQQKCENLQNRPIGTVTMHL